MTTEEYQLQVIDLLTSIDGHESSIDTTLMGLKVTFEMWFQYCLAVSPVAVGIFLALIAMGHFMREGMRW